MRRLPVERKTVLVVDDAPDNLTVMIEILKPYYNVKVAPKGIVALKIAQSKPDLILLDVVMPDMNGYEVIAKLKSGEETKAIPVLFVSSNSEPEEIDKGMKLGASGYLFKPIDSEGMLQAVERFIK
jgi:putative two-component system response regulator